SQEFVSKMESPSDSAVTLPSTLHVYANQPPPHTNSSRKQTMSWIPGQGTKIPYAIQRDQKQTKNDACESKSLDTGSCKVLQNDFVNENLSKQRLNEEKAKLVKEIPGKDLQRLKLMLLCEGQSTKSQKNKKLNLTQLIDHCG
ncbi:hypothetical protein FD755_009670, partial [Muntiacus reevesi]